MLAVAGWALMGCAALVVFDVLARNFLGFSTKSTVELSGYLLAFGIAWGLAGAFVDRGHVRVDVLLQRFPPRIRGYLHLAALLLLAVLGGFLTYGAFRLVQDSLAFRATDISVLKTPLWIPQGLWAAGIAVFTAIVVGCALYAARLLAAGRAEEVDRLLRPRTYVEEAAEAVEAAQQGAAGDARDSE
jgi:TRAP-type C4-dicarboxylate transport system permease small subunit